MKNRPVVTTLMLILLLVVLTPLSHAQSVTDMLRDLSVSHGSSAGGEVNGKIKNNSDNRYPCVRLDFNLWTHYNMRQAGEPVRLLGVLSIEVRDIQPRSERDYRKPLPFTAGLEPKPISACTGQITEPATPTWTTVPVDEQRVVLYENRNFGGRQKSYGIGEVSLVDFNDMASSIKVPSGLVVIVYEHSGQGVGYGLFVDFMEDQPNLAEVQFDKKVSHVKIVPRWSSGSVWIRNGLRNGQFDAGHYLVVGKGKTAPPPNPNPLIGPPIPAPYTPPPPPGVCSIAGRVTATDEYRSYISRTVITLHGPNGTATSFSMRVINGQYRFANVPEGTYEVRGTGSFPTFNTNRGPSGLRPFADGDQRITCGRDGSYTVNFEVRSTEG